MRTNIFFVVVVFYDLGVPHCFFEKNLRYCDVEGAATSLPPYEVLVRASFILANGTSATKWRIVAEKKVINVAPANLEY
jgi:hypothetical protein